MQDFLVPLSAAQRFANAATDAAKLSTARIRPIKRKPGRPAKPLPPPLDAPAVLATAAEASDFVEPAEKKSKYTHWWSSAFIHDILRAYKQQGNSARKAVAYLQRSFPRRGTGTAGRFDDLNESTVRSWFDEHGALHHRYQAQLQTPDYSRAGAERAFQPYPAAEEKIKQWLTQMRENDKSGISVNIPTIRAVMFTVLSKECPTLLTEIKLSAAFISRWAHQHMQWSWRAGTTEATRLPINWKDQGIGMAKRIAATVETFKIHPSLIINFDQAGLHLAPAFSRTYAPAGSRSVAILGSEDKRQITVVVGSAYDGSLLPLQLIFQGTTEKCHPAHTAKTREYGFHITHSMNHWSNQDVMQEYIEHIIVPYREAKSKEHNLLDAQVLLNLDAWPVHTSKEFRSYISKQHPYIQLVYVPARCTSKLQVADVALNYPFKHGVKRRYNEWAAEIITAQMEEGSITGLKHLLAMSVIKPKLLEWAAASWYSLHFHTHLIKKGWYMCVTEHYDIDSSELRQKAVQEQIRQAVPIDVVPEEVEADEEDDVVELGEESDDEKTEAEIMKEKVHWET